MSNLFVYQIVVFLINKFHQQFNLEEQDIVFRLNTTRQNISSLWVQPKP